MRSSTLKWELLPPGGDREEETRAAPQPRTIPLAPSPRLWQPHTQRGATESHLQGVAVGDAQAPHGDPACPLFALLHLELAAGERELGAPGSEGSQPQRDSSGSSTVAAFLLSPQHVALRHPCPTLSGAFLLSIRGNTRWRSRVPAPSPPASQPYMKTLFFRLCPWKSQYSTTSRSASTLHVSGYGHQHLHRNGSIPLAPQARLTSAPWPAGATHRGRSREAPSRRPCWDPVPPGSSGSCPPPPRRG